MPKGSWKAIETTSCTVEKKNNDNNNNVKGEKQKSQQDLSKEKWVDDVRVCTAQPRMLNRSSHTWCDLLNGVLGTSPLVFLCFWGSLLLDGLGFKPRPLPKPRAPWDHLFLISLPVRVMTRSHQPGWVLENKTLSFFLIEGGNPWYFIGRFLLKGKKLNLFLQHKDQCCCVGSSWVLSSGMFFSSKNCLSNPTRDLSCKIWHWLGRGAVW